MTNFPTDFAANTPIEDASAFDGVLMALSDNECEVLLNDFNGAHEIAMNSVQIMGNLSEQARVHIWATLLQELDAIISLGREILKECGLTPEQAESVQAKIAQAGMVKNGLQHAIQIENSIEFIQQLGVSTAEMWDSFWSWAADMMQGFEVPSILPLFRLLNLDRLMG
jgi:uncharacterized protein YpbB